MKHCEHLDQPRGALEEALFKMKKTNNKKKKIQYLTLHYLPLRLFSDQHEIFPFDFLRARPADIVHRGSVQHVISVICDH